MHSISDKDYWTLLVIDSLTGSLTDNTTQELNVWIAASEENRLYYEEMKRTWESLHVLEANELFDKEKAYRLFRERTQARKRTLRRVFSYAAVLIPFVLLSYFSFSYYRLSQEKPRILLSDITVPKGSKTQFTLEDGTKIWLNSGTSISFNKDFGKQERRIQLSGEAYLEVARNEAIPFIVETGAISVKVLGTKFNVNAYEENENIKVALLQGSVELLTDASSPTLLKPDEIALFNAKTQTMTVRKNTEGVTDWLQNRLFFSGETFEEIIWVLERNFNVKVTIKNQSIRHRRFIGDFKNNETIEQIFNVMASDGKFKYKIKGNAIEVY